jgi:calcineurin-like phosphoesterase family protein
MWRRVLVTSIALAILGPALPLSAAGAPATIDVLGAPADPVLVGAGDIATCSSSADSKTAALVETIDGTVFTAGDNVYADGTPAEFANCYDPTWGAFLDRTRPSPGNHDYHTTDAAGYFGYFGSRAGEAGKGYYAYDLGAWRIYVLNSNCAEVGGCGAGSPQRQWLKADLATNPRTCVLAYWHHPRFSSGFHGNSPSVKGFWTALYAAGADVVLNGHDHDYERFAKQRPSGEASSDGIREFVVGTGGTERRPFATIKANSQVRNATTFGVLKLTLHSTSYDFEFVPQAGKTFTDSRTGVRCSD